MPKGFFPQQDTGRLIGSIQADQGISFQAMREKLADFIEIVRADPAVENVVGFSGGGGFGGRNTGSMFVTLEAAAGAQALRRPRGGAPARRARQGAGREPVPGAGAGHPHRRQAGERRSTSSRCWPTSSEQLRLWEPRVRAALAELPELVDVNTDQQDKGVQTSLVIDRDTRRAARRHHAA